MNLQRGFTLIEVLITLSIIAILAAVSLPSLRDYMATTHADLVQAELTRTLQFARNEARARHVAVGVCHSGDQASCVGGWEQGLAVFSDDYADGEVHDATQIIAVTKLHAEHGKLYWRAFPHYRDYVRFAPVEMMRSDNSTFWYCHPDATTPVWAVMLNQTGRIRAVYPDKSGGIRDAHGNQLLCHQ